MRLIAIQYFNRLTALIETLNMLFYLIPLMLFGEVNYDIALTFISVIPKGP